MQFSLKKKNSTNTNRIKKQNKFFFFKNENLVKNLKLKIKLFISYKLKKIHTFTKRCKKGELYLGKLKKKNSLRGLTNVVSQLVLGKFLKK